MLLALRYLQLWTRDEYSFDFLAYWTNLIGKKKKDEYKVGVTK